MKPKNPAVKYSENATEERHAKLAKKKDALREIKMLINFITFLMRQWNINY
jgi:hypothetical protein